MTTGQTKSAPSSSLTGRILVSTPAIQDDCFTRTLVYIVSHSTDRSMGIICNKVTHGISFPLLLSQLGIETSPRLRSQPIHFGGPVESRRGFILHSSDYQHGETISVSQHVSLTATIDIVKDIAKHEGPQHYILALGYAGWGKGQLDMEVNNMAWLDIPADKELLFHHDDDYKWARAQEMLGFNIDALTPYHGHA